MNYKKTKTVSIVAAALIVAILALILIPSAVATDMYQNKGMKMMFPKSWEGQYLIDHSSMEDDNLVIAVYHKANAEKGKELALESGANQDEEIENQFGFLFAIEKIPKSQWGEAQKARGFIGGYVAFAQDKSYIYARCTPTDVQFDPMDQTLRDSYLLYQEIGLDGPMIKDFIKRNKLTAYAQVIDVVRQVLPRAMMRRKAQGPMTW